MAGAAAVAGVVVFADAAGGVPLELIVAAGYCAAAGRAMAAVIINVVRRRINHSISKG